MLIDPPNPQAQMLLGVIVQAIRCGKIQPGRPETFLTYSGALEILGEPKPRVQAGSRLAHKGLIDLNIWTMRHEELPKVAALIVNKNSHRPSAAFAESYDWSLNDPAWEAWWLEQADRAIAFDWSPYLSGAVRAPDRSPKWRVREDEEPVYPDYRSIITLEPGKRGGRPCIRGMRITVADILGWLAAGMSEAEVLDDFPELTPADIRAALAFAANRERRTESLAGALR